MNWPRHACRVVLGLLLSLAAARGELTLTPQNFVHSVSGQFMVSSVPNLEPVFGTKALAANTNLVHLEPALLAVAAERFKNSLWQQLGLKADPTWMAKFYLILHPVRSADESVTITSNPFLDRWNYRVELPDVLTSTRYARAMSAVLLLEIANRTVKPGGRSAEVPSWLVDGLAQQVLAADAEKVILSAPVKKTDGLPVSRLDQVQHDFDAFAAARRVLQDAPVLTFDQLSWPTDAQMNGTDGGIYFASVQLFLHDLLALKNGPEKLRALLEELPDHLNWQTSFFDTFREDFKRPLDVEKWWALRVVNFASRDPGPRWTTATSRSRLEELLSVPVEFRNDANALPGHAQISLQAALKNLSPEQRDVVLRTKLRDLALVELRLAPPFGELADGYRVALADFLGDQKKSAPVSGANQHDPALESKVGIGSAMVPPASTAHGPALKPKAGLGETLKKLDALDRRRREAEARSSIPLPGNSNAVKH
jgi:hypothetical protein